jgi:hypothetical protein
MKSTLLHGLQLFNTARFFDAHEALEDVWREAPQRSHLQRHLQGLVQLAVAFHHQSTGNFVGARSVLERGLNNLEGAHASFPDLDLEHLGACLKPWREYLIQKQRGKTEANTRSGVSPRPALPKITRRSPAKPA